MDDAPISPSLTTMGVHVHGTDSTFGVNDDQHNESTSGPTPVVKVPTPSTRLVQTLTSSDETPAVRFCGMVRVCLIPHRNAYPSNVRSRLWTPRNEIRKNAVRNTLEYAAEGWEVNGVVEDDDMVLCGGQRIHPIHFVSPDERHKYLSSFVKKRRRENNRDVEVAAQPFESDQQSICQR